MNLFFFLLIVFLVPLILGYIDSKTNYHDKSIKYTLHNEKGVTALVVPYFIWQPNKLKEIKERYSESMEYSQRLYKVIIAFENQKPTFGFAKLFSRYYYAELQLCQETPPSIVVNANIDGNNNNLNIVQNISYNIYNSIDELLMEPQISVLDKQLLELFKYKLKSDNATDDDAKNIIETLSKYTPYVSLVSTLIGLVKTIYSLF